MRYAVFGNPVLHSLSPRLHLAFAAQFNLPIVYEAFQVTEDELLLQIERFRTMDGKGFNVTAPYKQILCNQVVEMTQRAQYMQAVNTVTIKDGKLYGDNTDGVGFIRDLTIRHAITVQQKDILILGSGGAVPAILSELLALQPRNIMIANRDINKAKKVVKNMSAIKVLSYDDLIDQNFDIIINATSAGIKKEILPLPNKFNFKNAVCYDLNYLPETTQFLVDATIKGAKKTINGLGMLLEQAAESFYVWHNVRPELNSVVSRL